MSSITPDGRLWEEHSLVDPVHRESQAIGPIPESQLPDNYLTNGLGWKSWLFTLDHKRIAILYMISVSMAFMVGGIAAALVRFNLMTPNSELLRPQTYNKMFSAHGIVMVFFFLVPVIPATLGNFLVPLMIGAKDLAFPKINLLSWYLYMIGLIIGLLALSFGGVDTGWTFYAPLSTQYAYGNVALVLVGAFIAGFSSILTGLNFVITVHKMRAPGLTWFRLPLFIWSMYATSLIIMLATPVLAITLLLLLMERLFHIGIFDPKLGGDPVLLQHLFWFYSHPAVYIMVLPGFAVISELITCFARKPIFGYKFVAFSSIAIAVISFFVWGHHLFVAGQSAYAGIVFSVLSFLVAIPSAIKVFNWTATLYKGSIRLDTPMVYALGFIVLFTIGGLTGLYLASLSADVHLSDTYFVIAHFHYVMVGGTVSAYLGGVHYWWPKITGRMYPEGWGRTAAVLLNLGFHLTFMPQFILGVNGMPRRYATYAPEFQPLNIMSTAGATVLALGYLLPFCYLLWSLKYGAVAGPNPWRATGLEWQTTSPPPTFNFDKVPIVTIGPYAYNPEDDERLYEEEQRNGHHPLDGGALVQARTTTKEAVAGGESVG
ncbi:MAG: cytochrome c oxidase subunit I [Abitibacteriaceae bacterium]|nr:cytochrome c oxidase subunit I [Abditibacteriaceae bacterium]